MLHAVAFCHTLLRCFGAVKNPMTSCKVGTDHHGSGAMPAQRLQLTEQAGDGDCHIQLKIATHAV
jgi:hypothetical protein